jgi:transmembrane sensor
MDFKDEKELIDKYLAGRSTDAEDRRLEAWYNQHANELPGRPENIDDDYLKAGEEMWAVVRPVPVKKLFPYFRIVAAASIIAVLGIGIYLYQRTGHSELIQDGQVYVQDIKPGGNKAYLTLSNGKRVVLTDVKNGALAKEQETNIRKTADGQVVYYGGVSGDVLIYNTMTTPRGGKYGLTLADGTVVTLDAASSITYPVAFDGKQRKVRITGQVYFEVAHNAAKPFRVEAKGKVVEVLGTEFNMNAYDDEPVIKTTLLKGSVMVSSFGGDDAGSRDEVVLKPGEQAVSRAGDGLIRVTKVDTEEATAWKNGYFLFTNEPLESVMRKVSRWYDVDIVYPKGTPVPESYLGSITRYGNVSKVLQMLEITGDVKFRIEGKKIIVTKKSNTDK